MLTTLEEQATRANSAKKDNKEHQAWIENKVRQKEEVEQRLRHQLNGLLAAGQGGGQGNNPRPGPSNKSER